MPEVHQLRHWSSDDPAATPNNAVMSFRECGTKLSIDCVYLGAMWHRFRLRPYNVIDATLITLPKQRDWRNHWGR
jgi:hypothetical protein